MTIKSNPCPDLEIRNLTIDHKERQESEDSVLSWIVGEKWMNEELNFQIECDSHEGIVFNETNADKSYELKIPFNSHLNCCLTILWENCMDTKCIFFIKETPLAANRRGYTVAFLINLIIAVIALVIPLQASEATLTSTGLGDKPTLALPPTSSGINAIPTPTSNKQYPATKITPEWPNLTSSSDRTKLPSTQTSGSDLLNTTSISNSRQVTATSNEHDSKSSSTTGRRSSNSTSAKSKTKHKNTLTSNISNGLLTTISDESNLESPNPSNRPNLESAQITNNNLVPKSNRHNSKSSKTNKRISRSTHTSDKPSLTPVTSTSTTATITTVTSNPSGSKTTVKPTEKSHSIEEITENVITKTTSTKSSYKINTKSTDNGFINNAKNQNKVDKSNTNGTTKRTTTRKNNTIHPITQAATASTPSTTTTVTTSTNAYNTSGKYIPTTKSDDNSTTNSTTMTSQRTTTNSTQFEDDATSTALTSVNNFDNQTPDTNEDDHFNSTTESTTETTIDSTTTEATTTTTTTTATTTSTTMTTLNPCPDLEIRNLTIDHKERPKSEDSVLSWIVGEKWMNEELNFQIECDSHEGIVFNETNADKSYELKIPFGSHANCCLTILWENCMDTKCIFFIKVPLKQNSAVPSSAPADQSSPGAAIAIAFLIMLIIAVIALILYKSKRRIKNLFSRRMRLRIPSTVDFSLNSLTSPNNSDNRPIVVADFESHFEAMSSDSKLRFAIEFEELNALSPMGPFTAALLPENQPKNRWTNILPFDHSRVKLLPIADDITSDYINANYIPGYKSQREYIATQGPLPNTIDDFWRMVWEQGSPMIVMLTQCVERGKIKCEQYWPSDSQQTAYYGDLAITIKSESVLPEFTLRIFDLQLGARVIEVKQCHFTMWPDFGCPESTQMLLNFIRSVSDHTPHLGPTGPVIVHCSAGVGRTGTFIAVDRLMKHVQDYEAVDVFYLVKDMRKYRNFMVQTEDQYVYIHECIRDFLRTINESPRELSATESQQFLAKFE
ncbi:hypothetical protein CHUAL_008588 [Chamberlinius hualienensis]